MTVKTVMKSKLEFYVNSNICEIFNLVKAVIKRPTSWVINAYSLITG